MNAETCKLCPHSVFYCASMVLKVKEVGRYCNKTGTKVKYIEVCPMVKEEVKKYER